MNKSDLMEMALERLVGDMDDLEGDSAMAHSQDECPDPLSCTMHESEAGDALSGKPSGVEIEVKKIGAGLPSMKGTPSEPPAEEAAEHEGAAEDGLSAEEAEELRKLLK